MSTHGRTGIDHMIMGSVAEKVVARAPCPVLTIPPLGRAGGRAKAA
jgi:nucleotide-binding universal stress UspA family protein